MAGPAAVGIVQPRGTAVVLDASDGREILAAKLDPFDKLDNVAFLQSGDVTVLAAHLRDESKQQLSIHSRLMPGENVNSHESGGKLSVTHGARAQVGMRNGTGLGCACACGRSFYLITI